MTLGRVRTGLGVVGAAAALYGALVRPRLLRWGASDDEVGGPYPGGELVPGGKRGATMAVTIDAAPGQVWPWLRPPGGGPPGGDSPGPPGKPRPPGGPGGHPPRARHPPP